MLLLKMVTGVLPLLVYSAAASLLPSAEEVMDCQPRFASVIRGVQVTPESVEV